MNKFHTYLTELRSRQFKDLRKLCLILGIEKNMWRKIERGINPPPRKALLKKFCNLVYALSYEETQLYALARRWEPHKDTNTYNHILSHTGMNVDWEDAIMEPDYEHKYWG